ncbi:MAG: hypothetical protein WDN76_05465 [Alphaproteobacteria bacterium]
MLQIANVSALALFAWLALSVIALPMASLLTLVVVFVRLSAALLRAARRYPANSSQHAGLGVHARDSGSVYGGTRI